ncbi:porin [Lutibacter flavus]|uniref:Phosphate-selective porin n=1 Tax=Lutibacter flavus TaxID=691689 RepID=A0A238V894_9FLAO|nr:porin [Lutibacter flavus]SNR30421.1 Phosphate-selective porin [Lutibacter flavus]
MRTKIIILFALIFALNFNTSFAQGCEDDAAPTGAVSGVPSTSSMTIFGYIQPQYNTYFTDPGENTFNFKRARFGVRGRVNRSFSYYFVMETSAFMSGGDAYLLDAFVTYDKNEWAKISLGSFKQPFGLEVATACHSLTTIDRAIVSDQLVAPQRDYGLMLLGGSSKTKFRYSVAIMNGFGLRGDSNSYKDNNTKKDIIGRASYKLFDFMTLGGSFRYGYPNNNDKDRTTYGGEIVLNYGGFKVQGEYIYDEGDYNRAAEGGCGSVPLELGEKREGAYFMATYDVNEKFQPVFKYEYFDQDLDIKKIGYQEMMTIGANYFINKNTRLQVNYQNKIETGLSVDNDALLMQLQVKF